jgi:hypothetical protein
MSLAGRNGGRVRAGERVRTRSERWHGYRAILSKELGGEAILWAGRPDPCAGWALLPDWRLAVPIVALFLLSLQQSWDEMAALIAILCLFMLVLMPLAAVSTFREAQRLLYVLTDKRVVILRAGRVPRIRSVGFVLDERRFARGELVTLILVTGWHTSREGRVLEECTMLHGLPEAVANDVERLIRQHLVRAPDYRPTGARLTGRPAAPGAGWGTPA